MRISRLKPLREGYERSMKDKERTSTSTRLGSNLLLLLYYLVLVKPPPTPIGLFNFSFKVQATPENQKLLQELQMMAAKDGVSFSEIVRSALTEYHDRHSPGNPQ